MMPEYHVSPSFAIGTGDGTVSKPWDIGTAFTSGAILKPGDIIWLHGGRYHWDDRSRWELQFSGISGSPITVSGYPGERAILDTQLAAPSPDVGWFRVFGSHVVIRNLRLTCSSARPRTTTVPGSSPWSGVWQNGVQVQPGDPRSFRGAFEVRGQSVSVVNCEIDNLNLGLAHQQVEGGEIYGNVIHDCGWVGPDRAHGHGIYAQSKLGKLIAENVAYGNYSHGLHCYGEGALLNGLDIQGFVGFGNGERDILVGGLQPMRDLTVADCFANSVGKVAIGYLSTPNANAIVRDNVFPRGATFGVFSNLKQYGNTLGPITATRVFVRPNKHEIGRGHVIAYTTEASVRADLSSILANGTKYEIHRVWQLDEAPLLAGTYSGPVQIPMVASQAAAPISSGAQPRTMPGNFGVFLVRAAGQSVPVPIPDPQPIPIPAVRILSPADGTTLAVGQSVKFTGQGESLVWNLDIQGEHNPGPRTGTEITYTVLPGTTRIVARLTGSGGTDSRSYPVGTSPAPEPAPQPVPVPAPGAFKPLMWRIVERDGKRFLEVELP